MGIDFLVNAVITIMIAGSLFLAIVSYIPNFPKMIAPTWSTQFFSTVIVVIASKLVTLYAVLIWFVTEREGTPNAYFVWGYFLCMLFGIFVYFNFGTAEQSRAQTVRILESTPLAVMICGGILLYYSFSAVVVYSYWSASIGKPIFLHIAVISLVDFFFFLLLWLRYWLKREKITGEATAYRQKIRDNKASAQVTPL